MASPTPNKGYTYPAHGGAVGAWDTPLNTDFDYIDLNVGGAYPVTIVSTATTATYNSSGATISATVATVTFPSSLAQNLHYNLTGTQTQNIMFTYPAAGGFYIVGNNSSGAFTLTATVGSTITTTVAQGGRAIVVTDSAGAYPAQNSFGDITVNSLIASSAVTVGGPLTATGPLSQNNTGYGKIATGTVAQRPGSPAVGYFRGNTDYRQPEYYDTYAWRPIPVGQPIAAGYRNLRVTNTTASAPDTQTVVTADAVTVESTAGTAYRLRTVSLTVSSSFTGANGIDAGGLANNTWYGIYVIYSSSSDTTAGLISAQFSSSSVTMPTGYDAQARFAAMRTNGSAHFQRTYQFGNKAHYVPTTGSTMPMLPTISQGVVGTYSVTAPTFSNVSVASYVPTTASEIGLVLQGLYGNLAEGDVIVAPSTAYGGVGGGSAFRAAAHYMTVSGINKTVYNIQIWMPLDGTTISVVGNNTGSGVSALGWVDNL